MGSNQTVVCVKRVREEMPEEEWDEAMPLPGDIILGVVAAAASASDDNVREDASLTYAPAKAKSDLRSQLGKLRHRLRSSSDSEEEAIRVRVRRGDAVLDLRARVVPDRSSKLHRRFTIVSAADDRHVAVLADLSIDQCTELQEMSRRVVKVDGFGSGGGGLDKKKKKKKEMKYDWRRKVGTHLLDHRSTVVASLLFSPFPTEERGAVESTTARSMAWLSAAISSGVPLIFVNIQTEQIPVTPGIRLWFLPGTNEIPVTLVPEPGESRFGINIKRTEEGFLYICSVAKGMAGDRAGLTKMCDEASGTGHLVVISRLGGWGIMPSAVSASGLVQCCDQSDVRETLCLGIERAEEVCLHIMAWPTAHRSSAVDQAPMNLHPPNEGFNQDK